MTALKQIFLLFAVVGIVFLAGCSATERLDGTMEEGSSDLGSFMLGIDTGTLESTFSTTPAHVTCDLQGILSVDADVKMPASRDEITPFTAQRIALTPDQVTPLFFKGGVPHVQETTYANNPLYACSSDEGNLTTSTGLLVFNSSAFRPQIYDIALLSCQDPDVMHEAFADAKLTSIDEGQAASEVAALMKTLGVESYGEPTVTALSAAKLNELARENRKGTSIDDLFTLTKDDYSHTFTNDDEVCVVRLQLGYDGISITSSNYDDDKSDRHYIGSSAEAWVTKEGIVKFSLYEGLHDFLPSDSFDSIIPLDRALVLAAQKYSDVISNSPLAIRQIRFEYVPRSKDASFNHISYTPAWYLSPGVEQEKYATSIRVDALTGEVF